MSILVTGGAGFIGSHLCEALLDQGKQVVCVDNFDPFYPKERKMANLAPIRKKENFIFKELDILDGHLKGLMSDYSPEGVVHFAARPGVRPSVADPFIYEEINVRGTLNVLEAATNFGVKNFVFISSSSVYGNCPRMPWKETYEPLPASPYGASKLAGEAYVRSYSELYGLNASCLRYFSIYGPRQRPDLAISKFTDCILNKRPIQMFGDGSSRRDYTYITDAVSATLAALRKKFRFEVFNIGNSNPVQLARLINLLEQNLNRKARVKKVAPQKGDLKDTSADISKARKMLGFSPKVGIEEGIERYIRWKVGE
ncbi:MAG TPA: NAD-dependent epimerase/dehydratase family protein [Candidatus Norongarragalinales archaeon]|nr:NAD-dependent epimerase/dehydratase family protein [Candidatus Norongarragalinales archaeon]